MGPDFQTLVDAHYAALYRFALSLARNEADACDLTQQTFFQWANKGHQLKDSTKVKSWLFTSLYREFLGRNRHSTRFPHVELEEFVASGGDEPSAAPVIQSDKIDGQTVLAALAHVEEAYRAPLTLFYLEELSYKEIAVVLEIPIGTVMSRLSRGKAMLRQRLEEGDSKIVPINPVRGKEAKQ